MISRPDGPRPDQDLLLYDGDCPVCSRLMAWSRLQATRPGIAMIDARKAPEVVAHFRGRGMDVNDGIVLRLDGQVWYGAAAMALLARLSKPLNPVARWALRPLASDRLAKPLYPLLVGMRRALLLLLGRGLI